MTSSVCRCINYLVSKVNSLQTQISDKSAATFYAQNVIVINDNSFVPFGSVGENIGTGITSISATNFNIATPGTYYVSFQISAEDTSTSPITQGAGGNYSVYLNGSELTYTIVSSFSKISPTIPIIIQTVGGYIIKVTTANSLLQIMYKTPLTTGIIGNRILTIMQL